MYKTITMGTHGIMKRETTREMVFALPQQCREAELNGHQYRREEDTIPGIISLHPKYFAQRELLFISLAYFCPLFFTPPSPFLATDTTDPFTPVAGSGVEVYRGVSSGREGKKFGVETKDELMTEKDEDG